MPFPATRAMLHRALALALAGTMTLATARGASADDGLGGFLSAIFGGDAAGRQTAAPTSAPTDQRYHAPASPHRHAEFHAARPSHRAPLTVRLHTVAPKVGVAQVPAKPATVSIFEDRTLRRGDVVMMASGIRVFAGSASFPYTKANFIALAAAKDLDKDTAKVLAEVDRLPHG